MLNFNKSIIVMISYLFCSSVFSQWIDPFAFQRGAEAGERSRQQSESMNMQIEMQRRQMELEQERMEMQREQMRIQRQMRNEQIAEEQMRQQLRDDAYAERNAPEWQEGIFVRREQVADGALCFYKPQHGDVFVKGKKYREFTGRVPALGECPKRLLFAKSTALIQRPPQ